MSSSGLTYAFLIVPSLFAVVVLLQGFQKLSKGNTEGYVAIGFGVLFLILIITAYFFFIR